MKQKGLVKITKAILDIMFFIGVPITILVPLLLKIGGKYYPNIKNNYLPMTIIFMFSGLLAVCIIYKLRRIFKTVIARECFEIENVKSLKSMGIFSFGISILSSIRLLFVITPATLVIILTFFIAGLFSYVLAMVFEEAIRYKEENDLTI